MRVIGVDVGKKHCQACVIDEQGVILNEFPFVAPSTA
jgi:predicted NBD/HSP70 family sugar kinase